MNEFDHGVTPEDTQAYLDAMSVAQEEEVEQFESELPPAAEGAAAPTEAPAPAVQEQPTPQAPQGDAQSEERVAGQDGSVRDVAGAVGQALQGLNEPTIMTQATDAIAGMLGLGTPEERQAQREEGAAQMKENAQKAIDADPVGAAVADTLVNAVPGGAIDAVEDTLGAAEVIGDTLKTFASLGNIEDSQNPFSSNYDWAQWKLGADEIGAKTPVGQFAQELVSFAAIGSRLGAFKSFNGTVKGAGGVLKAAGAEAMYGMAADAIKGLAGEGNFANMLESVMPGLKDTWIMALAVDEDDNPYEAAVKSALDGAALGFPIGALGGVASAVRAAKGLPEEEAVEVFAKTMAEKAKEGEVKISPKAIEGPSQVVAERVKSQVPVYWDDVAQTVPELFTPGARVPDPDFAPSVYEQIRNLAPDDDTSLNPFTGEPPVGGTMVAIDGVNLHSMDPNDVADFIADNYDILTREDVYLGTFTSKITGEKGIELSRRVEDFEQAKELAKSFDQEGIFRMDDFSYHPTGGIDKLKETKGFHQRSAYTQPNYVRPPSDPGKTARLQFHPDAQPGGQGRLYTDSQIAKVAEAEGDNVATSLDTLAKNIGVRAEDMADMMSVDEVYERVSYDLDDFIDDGGHVDVSKLTKGVDGLLDQQGSLQTRILISNISSTIFNEARMVQMKSGATIDTESSLEIMTDNLKVLLRLHKKVANTRSRQLSQFAMPLDRSEAAQITKQKETFAAQDKGMDIAAKALDEMVAGLKSGDPKRIRQAKRTAAFMELTGGDPSKIAKVAKGIPGLYSDVMLKHMYNSLLSSPATHVINTFSNLTQAMGRPLTAALGGQAAAAKASFYNFSEVLSESWDLAARTWSEGTTQGSKMVQTSETDIALQNMAAQASTPTEKRHVGILTFLNDMANWPVLSWPSKFLTTSDEYFKSMNARMEYRVQNYLEAQELAKVTPGKDTDTIMAELMSDKSRKSRNFGKQDGRVMDPKLLDVAKELTFQTDLEGWAGKMAKFVDDVPPLRPFFPFIKTGHNIMVYTGTHTPVLNMALKESRKALRGDLGPYAQAVHRGRIAMGSMFMVAAGMAAQFGTIAGSGPKDKNRRSEWLKTHQPRSIKIGDNWVSFDRIEPFGQLLSAAADIHYAVTTGELEEDKAEYLSSYLMYAVSANLTDKTFFTGIKDLANIISPNGNAAGTKALNSGLNLVNNFMPGAGARRAITNGLTPYMQEYYKNYDRTLQQMGMGAFITPPADKIDHLTGEKISSPSAGMWNALMPVKVVERGSDVVKDALEDIYFETAEVKKEIGGIDLTPKQQGRLNELMAESGLHARIKKIVTNPKWRAAVEQHKEDMKNGKSNIPRTDQRYYSDIKRLYSQHQDIALEQLKHEYPELRAAIYNNQKLKKQARYGYVQGLIQYGNN